ncbi:MAG: cob(I)yrinic acid a,c-diamide adenosyltransferase [Euryarchaeota archaeon]|nr:cob(I)yrinic acid a,c-diamide adenosyltransferase [Euryarchaeota archaeon]
MARIYTRSGDKGDTSLFSGDRVSKATLRVEAYGTVDELNSVLSHARLASAHDDVRKHVRDIQRFLFILGADLATPPPDPEDVPDAPEKDLAVRRVSDGEVKQLEEWIDAYWAKLSQLDRFVVPGETEAAAWFHVARTVCRRAERLVVALAEDDKVGEPVLHYLNRLSDLLFTWGRYEDEGVEEADQIAGLRA